MIKTSLLEVLSIPRKIAFFIFLGMLFCLPSRIFAACADVYTLKGIIASAEVPRILVNNDIYLINDIICDGQVIEVLPRKIKVLFKDEVQEFVVNDNIYYRILPPEKKNVLKPEEIERLLSKQRKKKRVPTVEEIEKKEQELLKKTNASKESLKVAVDANSKPKLKVDKVHIPAVDGDNKKGGAGNLPKVDIQVVNQEPVNKKSMDLPFVKAHLSLIVFIGFLVFLITYVIYAVSLQILCERYEIDSPWLAWVPGVNFILLLNIIDYPWWCVLLLGVIFIPIVGIYLLLLIKAFVFYRIVQELQRPQWIAWICLIPGGEIVAISCLAFDKNLKVK